MDANISDRKAELSVIGAIMLDNDALHEINLKAGDFYYLHYQHIFSAILRLGKGIDIVTLNAATKGMYTVELTECTTVCTAANIGYYAKIIKDLALKRRLLKTAKKIINNIDLENTETLIEKSISDLRSNEPAKNTDYVKVGDKLGEVLDNMITRKVEERGLRTHIGKLDRALGFLRKGDLIIIAARPSMGKTSLALTLMLNMAINGDPCLMFSLETSTEQILERALSSLSGVSMQDVNCNINLEENAGKLVKTAPDLYKLPLFLNEIGGISYPQVERIIRKAHREEGIKCVYIDYLQLMGMTKGDGRNQQIGHVTRSLKSLAKNLNIPIILLSQLNRSVDSRANKRPLLSDLRDSGEIENDADIVIFIYRDEVYKPYSDDKGTAEIIIAKYRNGATGMARLAYLGHCMRFVDLQYGDEF